MSAKMEAIQNAPSSQGYSVAGAARTALSKLLDACRSELPEECASRIGSVHFNAPFGDEIYFPCPLREQEAGASIKALEGLMAGLIADDRQSERSQRRIQVDMTRAACFLMSAYMCTVRGMGKLDPKVRDIIPDTDLNKAQSIPYRRLSANLYETKDGQYYHIHGSLNPRKVLEMLNLPESTPEKLSYEQSKAHIGAAVKKFTLGELEELNKREGQAGSAALTVEEFRETPHGQALMSLPPFTVQGLEDTTPRVSFQSQVGRNNVSGNAAGRCLEGIRVIEMCRVIAGPVIGRSLAAHGAEVIKVTSPELPDVPFFQVDVNTGKHTTPLDLRDESDRANFESLLKDADVVIDGYRPGAVDRLGYGPKKLAEIAEARGKGIVYVAVDCFGGTGTPVADRAEWSGRPGWQQIADCVTGVAWEQGRFMGLDEPVVPPFPISDYGTGALGCIAAMTGLYRRAKNGGSWVCRTSLCQYDLFLLSLGSLPSEVQAELRRKHNGEFFRMRHDDSVDEISSRAVASMRDNHPELFSDSMIQEARSEGYEGTVVWPREPLYVEGLRTGHDRATRPNNFDGPTWGNWEEQDEIIDEPHFPN